jgi:hypothetical protein
VRTRTLLVLASEGTTITATAGETTVVVCLQGSCTLSGPEDRPVSLRGLDALFVTGVTEDARMPFGGDGVAGVVHIAVA